MAITNLQTRTSQVVTDNSAVGDDATDNRTAIQAVIDTIGAAGGGTVSIPEGVFQITRVNSGTAYALAGVDNLTIEGVGQGRSVLKLADGQLNFTRMFNLTGVSNVTFRNLTLDGNGAAQPLGTDQMHAVFMDGCTNVTFENVEFADTEGDGLYIGYTTQSENTRVINCNFRANGRSGITLAACNNTQIRGCHFNSDIVAGPIDSEPPGTVNVTNTIIDGNVIEGNSQFSITTVGVSHTVPSVGWTIVNNIIGGPVHFTDSTKGIFSNNIMVVSSSETQAIEIGYAATDWTIANNYIESLIGGYGIFCYFVDPYFTNRIRIVNNTIHSYRSPIRIDGADNVQVLNNHLRLYTHTTDPCLSMQATRSMTNVRVEGNTFINGIDHVTMGRDSTNTITGLVIRNNTFGADVSPPSVLRYNVNLTAVGAWVPGVILGGDNILTPGGTNTYFFSATLGPIRLGGLGGRGSTHYTGNGTPEGAVTAGIGSVYTRLDGGASTTMYVKESGTGNTGWVAK